jgi:alkanesulfonate monooxygenase SsuD/methylene tetrahydromethanopterin reductase-like flavin-dependent oxidoreductase (luciferase family)
MSDVRVGCVFRPENPPELLVEAARVAEDVGLGELWLWEDCFLHGGLTAAAIALATTSRLIVGVGVLPVPLRNVAITAMEIATLERTFPGRLRVGVGHGVQDWMGQVGERVASPLTLLREYTTALTALLRGETVTVAGRYVTLSDVRLAFPPTTAVDLLLGATGPRTLELSGELAAGTVITGGTSPDALREAVAAIRRGAGPNAGAHQVIAYLEIEIGGRTTEDVVTDARRWVDAGADTVVFQPPVGADAVDFIRTVGSQIPPLLASST